VACAANLVSPNNAKPSRGGGHVLDKGRAAIADVRRESPSDWVATVRLIRQEMEVWPCRPSLSVATSPGDLAWGLGLVERSARSGGHWWSPARPRLGRVAVASADLNGENAQLRSADPPRHGQAPALRAVAPFRAEPAVGGNGRARLHAGGKFLFDGNEKLYVRGATYGTFAADENGDEFPCAAVVARDFAAMAATGINAVRT